MLVLIDQALRGCPAFRAILEGKNGAPNAAGFAALFCLIQDGETKWLSPGETGARALIERLGGGQLAPPPEENQFLFIWKSPDKTLEDEIALLAKQSERFRIATSVLLIGPIERVEGVGELLAIRQQGTAPRSTLGFGLTDVENLNGATPHEDTQARFIDQVFFIGQRDYFNKTINEEERLLVAVELVSLLLAGGTETVRTLHLFAEQPHKPPFCAIGWRSWGVAARDWRPTINAWAKRLLLESYINQRKAQPGLEAQLTGRPSALLGRVAALGTPIHQEKAKHFRDLLPRYSANPFGAWRCPFVRESARSTAEPMIRRNRLDVEAYRSELQAALLKFGGGIRERGLELFRQVSQETRSEILAGKDVAGIAVRLKAFFPGFEALRDKLATRERSPCESASEPNSEECHKRFVDEAAKKFSAESEKLFSLRTCLIVAGICVALLLLSFRLFPAKVPMRFALFPGLIALLTGAGFFVLGRWRANRLARRMKEYFDQQGAWLYAEYCRKLDWVTQNVQLTLSRRAVADASALGRRLGIGFEALIDGWQAAFSKDAPTAPEARNSAAIQADGEVPEELQQLLQDLAAKLVDGALDENSIQDVSPEICERLERKAEAISARALAEGVNPAEVEADFFKTAEDWRLPRVLAALPEATLSNELLKGLLLPLNYPSDWEARFHLASKKADLVLKSSRLRTPGPAVWLARLFLTEEEFKKAIERPQLVS